MRERGDVLNVILQLHFVRLYDGGQLLVLGQPVQLLHAELDGQLAEPGQGADRVVPAVPLVEILVNLED